MKKAVTYIVLLAFLESTFVNVFVLVDYWLRLDYYSTELCENKDDPGLKCNGKCQLAKHVKSEDSEPLTIPEVENFTFDCMPLANTTLTAPLIEFSTNNLKFYHQRNWSEDFDKGFFHPPKRLSLIS